MCSSIGIGCDQRQAEMLTAFLQMLERWNRVYNLTAIRDPEKMLTHHLFDCLAAAPSLLRARAARSPWRLLDVGSGGGLPGVVLAIVGAGSEVVCVDAVGKKAAFVSQVAAELGLSNLRSVHSRVENLAAGQFDIVLSRAFGTLAALVGCTSALLGPSGVWAAMKGSPPLDEIRQVIALADVFHVEHLRMAGLDATRSLVWMRPLAATRASAAHATPAINLQRE